MELAKERIILQDRDAEILTLLFEQKVVDFKFLLKKYFPSRSAASRRISKLSSAGFVDKFPFVINGTLTYVYSLSKAGLFTLQDYYPYMLTGKRLQSDSINHDLFLVRIRETLSNHLHLENYFTENILACCEAIGSKSVNQPFAELRTDAVMVVNKKTHLNVVGIEYENNTQSVSRYKEKIQQYLLKGGFSAIFYIVRQELTIENLKIAYSQLAEKNSCRFFYILQSDFEKVTDTLAMKNLETDDRFEVYLDGYKEPVSSRC